VTTTPARPHDKITDIIRGDTGPDARPPLLETSPATLDLDNIPVERYISKEYLQLEYQRLWSRVWQWACLEEDIPNVGDFIVYEIGNKSVIVVRSARDTIKALINACLHRGRQLKEIDGHCDQFICGYHSWTYNLDGSLREIPSEWDFPHVQKKGMGLTEVRCERWQGYVFINFDQDAPPLADALGAVLPEHLGHYPIQDKYTAAHVSKVLPTNWKSGMEAFLESYHVMVVHPQIIEFTDDVNTRYDVWDNSSRLYTAMAVPSPFAGLDLTPQEIYDVAVGYFGEMLKEYRGDKLEPGQSPRDALAARVRTVMSARFGVDLTHASTADLIDHVQYWAFPNWCPWAGLASSLQYRWRPNGDDPDSCIYDIRIMLPVPPDGPRPPAAPVHKLGVDEPFSSAAELGVVGQVLDQDFANMAPLQKGMKTTTQPGFRTGVYQEARIRHFHKMLEEFMADPA
jgi:phenylpropionate dioxygenase-like ring-hydroxylating dioxygenase large terminal subunit